jgi:hypothetical protein
VRKKGESVGGYMLGKRLRFGKRGRVKGEQNGKGYGCGKEGRGEGLRVGKKGEELRLGKRGNGYWWGKGEGIWVWERMVTAKVRDKLFPHLSIVCRFRKE